MKQQSSPIGSVPFLKTSLLVMFLLIFSTTTKANNDCMPALLSVLHDSEHLQSPTQYFESLGLETALIVDKDKRNFSNDFTLELRDKSDLSAGPVATLRFTIESRMIVSASIGPFTFNNNNKKSLLSRRDEIHRAMMRAVFLENPEITDLRHDLTGEDLKEFGESMSGNYDVDQALKRVPLLAFFQQLGFVVDLNMSIVHTRPLSDDWVVDLVLKRPAKPKLPTKASIDGD